MAYVGIILIHGPTAVAFLKGDPKPGIPMWARYVSSLYPLAEMGPLLRHEGAQVGLDHAMMWVALSDSGVGLEDLLRSNFPQVWQR